MPTLAVLPKQRCRPDILHAPQGPKREDERCQGSVKRGFGKWPGMKREHGGKRQSLLDHGCQQDGREASRGNADDNAQNRQGADLQKICLEDRPAVRAQGLERGNDSSLSFQVCRDRGRDSDAADGQPGQPDKHEEGAQPVDECLNAGRSVSPVPPANPGEEFIRLGPEKIQVGLVGQPELVFGLEERARPDQPAVLERPGSHDRAWSEPEASARVVRFIHERGHEDEFLGSQAEPVSRFHAEARHQQRRHDGARQVALAVQGGADRHVRFQNDTTQKGIGIVHRFHLGQAPLSRVA